MLRHLFKKKTKHAAGSAEMAEMIENRLTDHELSMKELKDGSRKRLATINKEFRHTFKFLKSYPRSITFFGSARFTEDHPCYIRARELAKRIVEETGYAVITGGAGGIMEAANRGAYEAGGKSIGMNIVLPHEQKMNEFLTASVRFYYFFIRKVALSFSAEAYIYFPGGYGTMDEFFEIVTLMQTRKIPKVPIICVGRDFWKNVDTLSAALRDDFQTISPGDEKIYHITDSDEEIVQIIKEAKLRRE
ncbi:MAG TPA: TIGR00730 family Rossman fold protein [Candidatus Paceibacterota bacterium]